MRTRPLGTCRAPPLDDFGKRMFRVLKEKAEEQRKKQGNKKGKEAPKNEQPKNVIKHIAEHSSPPIPRAEALDKMLLVLFDALLLTQSEEWTRRHVANCQADETYELAR